MPKGKKTGGRDFKPGNPGGPGRPESTPEVKEARKLTRAVFEAVVHKLAFLGPKDLAAKMKDPKSTVLELMVGAVLSQAVNKGDHSRVDFILDRMVGKVPIKAQHSGEDGGPIQFEDLSTATSEEVRSKMKTIARRMLGDDLSDDSDKG